jgi:hypothetical protein
MKFVCLGCGIEKNWETTSKGELDALIEPCFTYTDELVSSGHWLEGGQALQSSRTAKTLRAKDGAVCVTDGPFAETKEQIAGIGMLKAHDMEHAIELMSKHPGLRFGPFEIRPVNEEALKQQMASQVNVNQSAAVVSNADTAGTFACLGYINEHAAISKDQFATMIEECTAFDKARRRDGHWLSGIGLQSAQTAKTLRWQEGKVLVTDGPFAETKEQLGGVVVNRFKDIQKAVEVLSKHPALRFGVVIEIRPIDEEMNARWEARKNRLKSAPRPQARSS